MAALRLADLDKILARQFQRGLHRLGPARDEINAVYPLGRMGNRLVGQRLGGGGCEKTGVGKGNRVQLRLDRRGHLGVAMAQTRHGSAARSVKIGFAVHIIQVNALPVRNGRRQRFGMSGEHMGYGGHERTLPFETGHAQHSSTGAQGGIGGFRLCQCRF